jgi:hypothetical protein
VVNVFPSAEATDNASVSFVTYKGDYYVSTETTFMHKVDPETLETTGKVQRGGSITHLLTKLPRLCAQLLYIE